MAPERIRLQTRDRRSIEGDGDVVRFSQGRRLARGGAIVLAGLAVGLPTIAIPVLHLVLPWALPLLGLMFGILVWMQAILVKQIRATCPDCGTAIEDPGGSAGRDLWVRCPKCTLALHVEVE